jgi:hypothetical protein
MGLVEARNMGIAGATSPVALEKCKRVGILEGGLRPIQGE